MNFEPLFFRLPLFWIGSNKAHDRYGVQVRHELVILLFLPHFPGAPRSERPLLPNRTTAFREGHKKIFGGVSEDFLGGDRESRRREAAGRRNLARSSAQKNERQKKAGLLNCEDRCGVGRAM